MMEMMKKKKEKKLKNEIKLKDITYEWSERFLKMESIICSTWNCSNNYLERFQIKTELRSYAKIS